MVDPPTVTAPVTPDATPTTAPTATRTPRPTTVSNFQQRGGPSTELVLHVRDINVWDDASMAALEDELEAHGVDLMTYWDLLADVARQVNAIGIAGDVVSTDTYRLWVTRDGDLLNVRVYR